MCIHSFLLIFIFVLIFTTLAVTGDMYSSNAIDIQYETERFHFNDTLE